MPPSWKLVAASVAGTSHHQTGDPCQDYALARMVQSPTETVLVAVCADGAGSSRHAEIGAKLACLGMVRSISAALDEGTVLSEIDFEQVLHWHGRVRGMIALEACLQNLPIREFACTLLTVVIGDRGAVFSQIGDGVIIRADGNKYCPVFWPQSGEYASTTFFLTGQGYEDQIAFRSVAEPIDEVALLTDGLQPLALHYASKSVHAPFFTPMFQTLRQTSQTEDLDTALKQFLASKPVNDRTDDDKTLILASRRPLDYERPLVV